MKVRLMKYQSPEISVTWSKETLIATKRNTNNFVSRNLTLGVTKRKSVFEIFKEMVEPNPGDPSSSHQALILRQLLDAFEFF